MALLLDYRHAGEWLDLSDRTVRRLVHDGELPAVKIGGATRIRRVDLEAYVENLGTKTGGTDAADR
jgi:excisionase family DNA binding protein